MLATVITIWVKVNAVTDRREAIALVLAQKVWLTRIDNVCDYITPRPTHFLFVIVLVLTMAFTSTSDSLSIFKDGKLKPGIYKIQSLYIEAFLDVEEHSREIYCHPFQDLRDGRGLVRRQTSHVVRV